MTEPIIVAGSEFEIFVELLRSAVLTWIVIFLSRRRALEISETRAGWNWILAGFVLLLVSSLLDVTDNFPGLNQFVVIGDTEVQAVLEEGVTGLGGFILIIVGLLKWVPAIENIGQEIAERRRAETERDTSEVRFRTFIDNLPSAVSLKDGHGRYVLINHAYETMFAVAGDVVVGAAPGEVLPAGEAVHTQDHDRKVRETQQVVSEERFVEATDGRRTAALITKFPVYDSASRFSGIGAITTDITERMDAEQRREILIRELEDKNAEMERFTYTVSHDLKSPLITIGGFLGVLERHIEKGDQDGIAADIARIRRAAASMQVLLDDVLELSRIGRLVNDPVEVALNEIIDDAVERVTGRLDAGGVQVSVAPDLPRLVADRPRLVEVFQNLIDNAAKFMGDQTAPEIQITAERTGDVVTVRVRDNGMGIAPDYLAKIFGLFDRLDRNGEGTGIGLAIVKRVIEVHGGGIRAESEGVGKGTTFIFTLAAGDAPS